MMLRAIKTEFVKFFTTRLWWGMAIAVAAIAAVVPIAMMIFFAAVSEENRPKLGEGLITGTYTAMWNMGAILLLVIGIMLVGQERSQKTLTSTFLSFPKRAQLLAAKVIAMLGIGAFYGLIYLVVRVGIAATWFAIEGHDPFPNPGRLFAQFGMLILVLGLWGLMGLGLGILIPNQIAAMLVGVGVALIVEPILGTVLMLSNVDFLVKLSHVMPTTASDVLLTMSKGSPATEMMPEIAPWWVGLIAMLGWGLISAALGSLLIARKDVS